MNVLLVLPVVLPLVVGGTVAALRSAPARAGLALGATAVATGASVALVLAVWRTGIVVTAFGGWPAPFGIVFAADMLGALMTAIAGWVALVTLVMALLSAERRVDRFLPAGWLFLLGGMNGAFLTGDLFNLYVFFEVMLVASYFLLTLGTSRRRAREAFTYVVINLVASTLFLVAVALLYGATGTVNMADLARRLPEASPALSRGGVALLATAFAVKAALFPLYFWLPHAYVLPPGSTAAYFGGMLTKVGVYALFRLFTTIWPLGEPSGWLLLVAGLTMSFGVLGALAQEEIRAILSFHIISQIGYMVMGLGLQSAAGLAGGIFYIIHHIGVKTALLLAGATVEQTYRTGRLERLSGIAAVSPALGALFFVPALSLAGLPPFSGFWAKLALLRAGLEVRQWVIVAVSLAVSLLTLLSMLKIFSGAFWGAPTRAPIVRPIQPAALGAVAAMATLTIAWGLAAHVLLALSATAAEQLLDAAGYRAAVLGVRP
ncbi:MAG: proton-conducting transporter membrane subunit [Armatimonadota bacterium]|nr:proton-conducting transporter membrane subunit [Armatimonadota bacterium]MDR7487954.1 proton-conducting transporter membrane subunit [Armatimonadota bacterium]MDR7491875.1 proton-conducting transporter membrane subunit [Armatimonadota bacterium]MDR7528386.1 proton-conducting transporter membrane subunit [Armatimonadota bacterium]MDR7574124.1 proton-conducting transporter membrane subunit [Armatimonadota bacterium]